MLLSWYQAAEISADEDYNNASDDLAERLSDIVDTLRIEAKAKKMP
jgi:hypothetical protein